MTATLTLPVRAESEQGLVLETGSPDALCPELSQARAAVSRRLGALEVAGHRGFRARYTVGHAPEGSPRDFVRLELFDSEGARELVRDLPMNGESCSTMAEAIALVLDRHFRGISPVEIEGKGEEGPFQAAPPPQTPQSAQPLPVAAREQARASADAPASVPVPVETSPALLFLELAASPSRPVALGPRALLALGPRLLLESALLFDLHQEREELPLGGQARAARAELRAALAWRVGSMPWLGYLGPALALGLQRGEARDVSRNSKQLRALWAGGVEAGGGWCISRRIALEASGSLLATALPLSGRFFVGEQEVLRPSVVQLQVGLGAGYAF